MTHRHPHLCPDCGLCTCSCDDCGRIACACLECPCDGPRDHAQTECAHLKGKAPPAWADIVTMYQKMLTPRHTQPSDPTTWRRTPVLATDHPFPIRYAPDVWEHLHPIDEPRTHPRQTFYLTSGRARTRQ